MDNNSINFLELISEAMVENATLVLAIFIGGAALVSLSLWRKRRGRNSYRKLVSPLKRSASLALIHGGELALQRLVEYHEARVDSNKLNIAECELKLWFNNERPDFRELARITAKLEMSGKEEVAIGILDKEINNALRKGKLHEAYELEMLLVEMLIYKGEFEKALNHKCLEDHSISDARRPLYKAIIFLMNSEKSAAEASWREFCELRMYFGCQPAVKTSMEETGTYKVCVEFEEFEKIVKKLKEDIEKAQNVIKTVTNNASTSKN